MNNKNTINLFQAELLPKVVFLTLNKVVMFWGLSAVVMAIAVFSTQYQINKNSENKKQLANIQLKHKNTLSDLEHKLKLNKPSSVLLTRLSTLKYVMKNKQALHAELTNDKTTYVVGFAKAMTDLSNMHSTNISLNRVVIDHNEMTLIGLAKSPEAIPAWLTLFSTSSVLSGKVFSHFTLAEDESDFTHFVVSTSHEAGTRGVDGKDEIL
jgi:hypothetical protein